MKKLVLIENAPWRVEKNLLKLKKAGIEIEKILFFVKSGDISEEDEGLVIHLEKTLDTKIEKISISNFYSMLDKYYNETNSFLLFNLNLDEYGCFEERINVRYANSKNDKGFGRIWFYTTSGNDMKSMLEYNFKGQSIDVERFYKGQLYWNHSQILQIAKKY